MSMISVLQIILGAILIILVSTGSPPRKFTDRILNLLSAIPGSISITCAVMQAKVFNPYLLISVVSILILIYLRIRILQFIKKQGCVNCIKSR